MRAPTILTSLALIGLSTAWAIPSDSDFDATAATLVPRDGKPPSPTSPWIEVDDEGQPLTTHRPSMTTVSGTPTAIDGAPHDLTASVYTWTTWGIKTTSTGLPPNPTATGKGGQGAFERCHNLDGEYAPLCRPSHNSTLETGNTYYVTWDPDYYNKTGSNVTYNVAVRLDYLNTTDHVNEYVKLKTFDHVPAKWGFWPLQVDGDLLKGHKLNNVTITLLSSELGSGRKSNSTSLPVAVAKPRNPKSADEKLPAGDTLVIALPLALGAVVLLVCGLCVWNRNARRIQLGSIMSRSGRHGRGYSGRGVRRRMFSNKDHGIQLETRPLPGDGADHPRASPAVADPSRGGGSEGYHDFVAPQMSRRDSDALDSLAGSPVNANFPEYGTRAGNQGGGGRNAFREELERQQRQREGDIL